MTRYLQEALAAAGPIINPEDEKPKTRAERIEQAASQDASSQQHIDFTYDKAGNQVTKRIEASHKPDDLKRVIAVAQVIAQDETFQWMEISEVRARNSVKSFELYLQKKYENAEQHSTSSAAVKIGDRTLELAPQELQLYQH